MISVKICGISDVAALDAAVAAGADHVGFVFFPPSPRAVTAAAAAALAERVPEGVGRVGLFVRPTMAEIAAMLDTVRLDAVQLYGPAPAPDDLRARFGMRVWRARGISRRADLPDGMDGADMLVLEAQPPEGATRPGGNAATFDWTLLRDWQAPGPWVLAGGLTPANVADAVRVTGARAVDVSSGVETAPGRKDPALIRDFVAAARSVGAGVLA